jgi:hypothetical protein
MRVGKTGKAYYAERKVSGKTIRFGLGDAKLMTLEEARELARKQIALAIENRESPNKTRKVRDAAEVTLGQAWDRYLAALQSRPQKPKQNSIDSIEKCRARLKRARPEWEKRRVKTLTGQEVVDVFNEVAAEHRTTAEQIGRWASSAVRHCIRMESHDAQSAGRTPTLTYDPFGILGRDGLALYRTRSQMEEDYEARGIRNPMTSEALGKFIEACWAYRRNNQVASDFLLLTLLWGARRGESCKFVWRDRIDSTEALKMNWIDLQKKVAHFHDPKNRISFDQPIASCAMEILKLRKEETVSKWVFPADSPRAADGHYKDPQHALKTIKTLAGLGEQTLRPHDLRRTAGRVAESMNFSETAIKNILGHATTNVTSRYTDPEWKTRLERMEKLEARMLSTAPSVYNILRPLSRQPLGETVPAILIPRTKKPRKSRAKEALAVEALNPV